MQKIWFKRKSYGWGWYPSSWQGWLVVLLFILLHTINILKFLAITNPTRSVLLWFFVKVIVLVVAVIYICYETGETPRWQWGKQKTLNKS